jgi:ActR/RegA family two-component response regulator
LNGGQIIPEGRVLFSMTYDASNKTIDYDCDFTSYPARHTLYTMRPTALILTQDASSAKVLSSVLDELRMEQTLCRSHHQAMELLLEGNTSALVIDFDAPGAIDLAKITHLLVPQRRPAVFALIGTNDTGGQAAQAGANVTLYKPLVLEDVRNALHAGKKMMHMENRKSQRHKMKALVYLELESGTVPSIGIDVSEHGIAVQAAEPIPLRPQLSVRFVLPETSHGIDAVVDVIWADQKGRAGMFFTQITPAARKQLKHWLAKRGSSARDAVRVLLSPADACFSPAE